MKEKHVEKIGWFASMAAILMFSSFLDQIALNVQGQVGSIVLPIATTINCSAWVLYALSKKDKDWPIFVCNLIGIIAGSVTAITGLVYRAI